MTRRSLLPTRCPSSLPAEERDRSSSRCPAPPPALLGGGAPRRPPPCGSLDGPQRGDGLRAWPREQSTCIPPLLPPLLRTRTHRGDHGARGAPAAVRRADAASAAWSRPVIGPICCGGGGGGELLPRRWTGSGAAAPSPAPAVLLPLFSSALPRLGADALAPSQLGGGAPVRQLSLPLPSGSRRKPKAGAAPWSCRASRRQGRNQEMKSQPPSCSNNAMKSAIPQKSPMRKPTISLTRTR